MKYVAYHHGMCTRGYRDVKFVHGYGFTLENGIRELKALREQKQELGVRVFNITQRSFETDEL